MHIQERIWEHFERPSFSPPRPDEDTTHRTWAWNTNRHRRASPFAFPKSLIGEREKAAYGKEKENESEARMTDEAKADAIADAFDAMRAQRKSRRAAIMHGHQWEWSQMADRADAKAVAAVAALLAVFRS